MLKRLFCLILFALIVGFFGHKSGLPLKQAAILTIFSLSILGTLFFWQLRLGFVFIGSGILLTMGAVGIDEFIKFASLDVVLFLISMMIVVSMMKDAGLFAWLLTLLLRVRNLTGQKMFAILMLGSALFSALMGEVASIIIVTAIVFYISDFIEVDPVPLVLSTVIATNIGSAATVLGNPVGVLIAVRGGLSFEDFIAHAMPVSIVVLLLSITVILFSYRTYIQELTVKLTPYVEDKEFLYLLGIAPDVRTRISIVIFLVTIVLIGFHKRLEHILGLEYNTLLIMIPVMSAGLVLFYRHDRARHYIETQIEWPSLLFFMFLFAQAGIIHATGIADFFVNKLVGSVGNDINVLSGVVLFVTGILSGVLDNVVTVASFIPVISSLAQHHPDGGQLWWALLFGACFGGNLTMIGSTANIVALGLLEKDLDRKIDFMTWIRIGVPISLIGLLTSLVVHLIIK